MTTSGGLVRKVVYLPPEVEEELRDLAHGLRRTESDLIREAVAEHLQRLREGWQAQQAVDREVDGRLSDRASHYWPGALVVRERREGREQWWLERQRPDGSTARTEIGSDYHKATRALGAIIRTQQATTEATR